jgi:hypothetical protein
LILSKNHFGTELYYPVEITAKMFLLVKYWDFPVYRYHDLTKFLKRKEYHFQDHNVQGFTLTDKFGKDGISMGRLKTDLLYLI